MDWGWIAARERMKRSVRARLFIVVWAAVVPACGENPQQELYRRCIAHADCEELQATCIGDMQVVEGLEHGYNSCSPSCESDSDCVPPEEFLGSMECNRKNIASSDLYCVMPCTNDEDCPSPLECINERCLEDYGVLYP